MGEVPDRLKSQEISRRPAASVPRVARSEPNSSRNIDLLDEGERYIVLRSLASHIQTSEIPEYRRRWKSCTCEI